MIESQNKDLRNQKNTSCNNLNACKVERRNRIVKQKNKLYKPLIKSEDSIAVDHQPLLPLQHLPLKELHVII